MTKIIIFDLILIVVEQLRFMMNLMMIDFSFLTEEKNRNDFGKLSINTKNFLLARKYYKELTLRASTHVEDDDDAEGHPELDVRRIGEGDADGVPGFSAHFLVVVERVSVIKYWMFLQLFLNVIC
jgi:hypothetical protein